VGKYPKVADLATADQEEVLKDWQGLGYYSRARNLHSAANMIVEDFDGEFPNTYVEIKKLKGVGDYTAAAIASFAYGEAKAVVDGNVYRLLARYFGIETPIDSTAGKKEFAALAQELIPEDQAGIYNQAIMEFGALQCKPKNPDCQSCPLQTSCAAYAEGKIDLLPIKARKTKVRDRFFHYLILETTDQLILRRRSGKGIWQNLFDFPLIEAEALLSWEQLQALVKQDAIPAIVGAGGLEPKIAFEAASEARTHLLSHQKLHCRFFHLRLAEKPKKMEDDLSLIKKSTLGRYPIPKLIENYLREETNLLSLFKNQS
jgi:A/G-specific adenine glycosylase